MSESLAERLTEAAGAAYVAEETVAVEHLERQPTPEPRGPARLQMSADGAMISLVGKLIGRASAEPAHAEAVAPGA